MRGVDMARLNIPSLAAIVLIGGMGTPALAQKNSGPLLPITPPYASPPQYAAPPYSSPPYTSSPPRPSLARAGNPDAERLAQSLPLDPQTRELRDQMPADPRGTERRLGLREPRGPATDLRGRAPSSREIVDALAPR
jgi:hypothetical protein